MKVWQDVNEWVVFRDQIPSQGKFKTALTIGNFDGIHCGHQELLRRTVREAQKRELHPLLLTFYPHPSQVLTPEKGHVRIFSLKDQQEQLALYGIKGIFRQPFSREFSNLSAVDFLESYLMKTFQPGVLVVGHDFRFGAHRSGTPELIEAFSQKNQISFFQVPALELQEQVVSTSQIRTFLQQGKVGLAEQFLGRRYHIQGIVEKGDARGRTLGFPTANIRPDVDFYPRLGVYAGVTILPNGERHPSVMNLGVNRTFVEGDHQPIKVEVHLLGFQGDLYGQFLQVELVQFLRDEKKFSSIQDLVEQIRKDAQFAREILK